MFMVVMDEELIEFLSAHPEYFEGAKDCRLIAHDIRSMVEAYALALDTEEYKALRIKVAGFRAKQELRVQSEIKQLSEQIERERKAYDDVMRELASSEAKLKRMQQELDEVQNLSSARNESVNLGATGKSHFHLILDFVGILFLYVGFVLSDNPEPGYIVAGVFCILAGFVLQQKKGGGANQLSAGLSRIDQDMRARNEQFMEVWRIKRQTLHGRKKLALSKINECDNEIQYKLSLINASNTK